MHASTIATFIGEKMTQTRQNAQCVMLLVTRKGRKLLEKLCGTFGSIPVCNGTSLTPRKQG
jgi:hypothetical protein